MLPVVNSFEDLLSELERLGYNIKHGKYISVKAPDQKRSVRLKTLGEDYTEESLKARILWRKVVNENTIEHFTNTEIERAYIAVIGEVRILAEQKRKVQRRADVNIPYAPNNDLDIHRLSTQLTIINRDNLSSIGELEGKMNKLSAEYKSEQEQLSRKLLVQEQVRELIDQCQYYFDNVNRNDLKDEEKIRLDICKSSMQAKEINNTDDVNALRQSNDKMLNEINSLNNSLAEKKNKLAMYSDICNTYYEISKGDYISRLVEEENRRREQENNKEVKKSIKKKGNR